MKNTTLADQLAMFLHHASIIGSKDARTHVVLADMFKCSPESEQFHNCIFSIRKAIDRLIEETENDHRLDHDMKDHFLSALRPIRPIFQMIGLVQPWNNSVAQFSQSLLYVKMLANFHRLYKGTEVIGRNEIAKIIEELKGVLDYVDKTNLSDELKAFMNTQINSLISALNLANFVPVDALWDMTFKVIGDLLKEKGTFKEENDEQKESAFDKVTKSAKRVLGLCKVVKDIDGAVQSVESINGHIQNLLQ